MTLRCDSRAEVRGGSFAGGGPTRLAKFGDGQGERAGESGGCQVLDPWVEWDGVEACGLLLCY